jgi:predicted ATPase/class 3 adenylate cyclase
MTGAQHSSDDAPKLPSGVLTIMFTDLEDSTVGWEAEPAVMRRVMNVHDEILNRAVDEHGGVVFKSTGDGLGAVFTSPGRAVDAAVVIQKQLQAVPWPHTRPRVRIGLHLGDISPTRGDYYGAPVNRAARITDCANGDQIAVSAAVASFLDPGSCVAVGEHQLRGIGTEVVHLIRRPEILVDERPLRARLTARSRPLPAATSSSIGRLQEVSDAVDLLVTKRSVTLVGSGGVGKTHTALDVGRRVERNFADGAVIVELADLRDGDAVVDAVAAALGARVQPGMDLLQSVVDFLEGREVLVILDNCEHVATAARAVVTSMAGEAGVSILATSRSPIGFPGEQVLPLRPLHAPTDGVELFLERASERDPTLAPTTDEHRFIEEICERLDGLPLGIELAAAWVRILTPRDLLQRLESSLEVGPDIDTRERQHTLHSTIRWSYEQLTAQEAELFDRLSVFVGGFTIESAEVVCTDDLTVPPDEVVDLIMGLVDKSMVVSERHGDVFRFRLLRTLQAFGAEHLSETDSVGSYRSRHADYFAAVASDASERLISTKEPEVWDRLHVDWANVRASFDALVGLGRLDDACQMLLDLGWYSTLSLRSEPFAWAERLLTIPEAAALEGRASLHGLRAIHKYFTVDHDSRSDAERGLELDPSDPYGYCRIALGAVWLKNQHVAQESDEWTRSWLRALTDSSPMMSRLWAHGMRAFHLCVHDPLAQETREHVSAIDRIASDTSSTSATVLSHWANGMYSISTGDSGEAGVHWRKGLDAAASLTDLHLVAQLIVGLRLHFAAPDGDLDEVLRDCRLALHDARERHYLAGTSHLFGVTAIALSRAGLAHVGARLVQVMESTGHIPRDNAIDALRSARPANGAKKLDENAPVLSVRDAAALADQALTDAIGQRTAGLHSRDEQR